MSEEKINIIDPGENSNFDQGSDPNPNPEPNPIPEQSSEQPSVQSFEQSSEQPSIQTFEQEVSPTSQTPISVSTPDSEFHSAKSENELFFEKFNNTKKNYKKAELEKARKQINKKNKTLSFERRLEDNRYVGKIYGIVGGVIALILSISITVFVLNYQFLVNSDYNSYQKDNMWYGIVLGISKQYGTLNKAVVIMSGIAFSLVPVPFFFLLSTWFMGLNQIFRSRNFMIFMFTCIGLSLLIVLITIPMFSVIYAQRPILPFNNSQSWDKK